MLIAAWLLPGVVLAQAPDGSLVQFLEARVPDELAVEGIVLTQRDLGVVIHEVGDQLLITLVAHATGTVVASMKVGYPASDREASLAIVTQVTATMFSEYTASPASVPVDVVAVTSPPPVVPPNERSGLTFDVGLGLSRGGGATGSSPELAFGVSLGAWIFPSKLALLGRVAMSTVDQSHVASINTSYVANEFIGANLQYWFDDHAWVAGGPGLVAFSGAEESIFPTLSACSPDCVGIGFDLRAGYSLGIGAHQLELSLEALPGYYANDPSLGLHVPENGQPRPPAQAGATTSVMALLGYRFL